MDDETSCPRCRTTKYRNPNLKLMVNVCGHTLCENCVEMLFIRGSGTCPECNIVLRRTNFRLQFFEDATIEKEIEIRKKILKDFNCKENDFPTLREYNDYLETVETIIFNLVNGEDLENTRQKVEAHRRENKELIAHNKFKKSADDIHIDGLIAVETAAKGKSSHYNEEARQQAIQQMEKDKAKELLIQNLMFSDASAQEIVQSHQEIQRLKMQDAAVAEKAAESKPRPSALDITNQLGHQTTFMPIPKSTDVLYKYEEFRIYNLGPEPPLLDDVKHKGYLRNMRASSNSELAGGYHSAIGCMKALESAVEGLFLFGPQVSSLQASSDAASSAGSSERMDISP